jgi:hypothetical protein
MLISVKVTLSGLWSPVANERPWNARSTRELSVTAHGL